VTGKGKLVRHRGVQRLPAPETSRMADCMIGWRILVDGVHVAQLALYLPGLAPNPALRYRVRFEEPDGTPTSNTPSYRRAREAIDAIVATVRGAA
jgi:hypothetical protein